LSQQFKLLIFSSKTTNSPKQKFEKTRKRWSRNTWSVHNSHFQRKPVVMQWIRLQLYLT